MKWKAKILFLVSITSIKDSEATRNRLAYVTPNFKDASPKETGSRKENEVRYNVEWAGSSGLLQMFRNVMNTDEFEGWLRKPIPAPFPLKNSLEDLDVDLSSIKPTSESDGTNKLFAESKASQPLDPNIHLQPLYVDQHIVVVNKESGALSVPGPRRKPSVGSLVHEYFGNEEDDVDCMIVHRLDMDTSGVICYARSKYVLAILHDAFRSKSGVGNGDETVFKKYEALVCGHMDCNEGEIDLPLVRDRHHPPFMKVGIENDDSEKDNFDDKMIQKHKGYMKMMSKAPKESLSLFRVMGREYLDGIPVTRLELTPITGRTHQLRVHCAAIGHPIIGDNIYGFKGDGSPHGGLSESAKSQFGSSASESVQNQLYNLVHRQRGKKVICDDEYNGDLALHAKQLCIWHPITKSPMLFEKEAPF